MIEFWDDRYSDKDYFYGIAPNEYYKSKLNTIPAGSLLLPGEGEGRNAVYAARQGWTVEAFDFSNAGKSKALNLAKEFNVKINYRIGDAEEIKYPYKFDAAALIFSHIGKVRDNKFYNNLSDFIKPNGYIIFECFSKRQIEYQKLYNSGGPSDTDMLFTIDEILFLFPEFEVIDLAEREKVLNEGSHHSGLTRVINFFGRKKAE